VVVIDQDVLPVATRHIERATITGHERANRQQLEPASPWEVSCASSTASRSPLTGLAWRMATKGAEYGVLDMFMPP
jgi:hypothetical protein